jgi:phosphatidylserine/phosphatidylglycerophosphate/cardiolipin synthase-like enzyme
MNAVAISNNDMVYLHWHVDGKVSNCLGFNVIRHDAKSGRQQPLPAMVGFPTGARKSTKAAGERFMDTSVWPIQKYAWKDVFATRGRTYWYEIVPMLGAPGNLKPDMARAMRTNTVTLDSKRGDCSIFFNRGIISTQAIAHSISKGRNRLPNSKALERAIADPNNPIRARLTGDLEGGVLTLLQRAKENEGECFCALYELSDKDLIEHLVSLGKRLHLVLSNAGEDTRKGRGDGDSTNVAARRDLHKPKGADVTDHMLKKGHIGLNKFVVYVDKKGPQAVLSGSTNWTPTGLCAQSNNAILVENSDLAKDYLTYWRQLKEDTIGAGDHRAVLQRRSFRDKNRRKRSAHGLTNAQQKAGGGIRVWFSPNTPQKSVPRRTNRNPPTPADLKEVFEGIENAKQGVLFLAFIPGSPSIVTKLKQVYDAKTEANQLFYLRGAATSPDPASLFRVDLYHRSSKADASVRGVENPRGAEAKGPVASVAGIFATFAKWEAEIYKLGHAVIHDKILVIDPFTDDSGVITGSHNLGFRASYNNDENVLIVRGDRAIAEAYAAHVLDVYEHYRWRWRLQQPLRDRLQALKKRNPKAKRIDLWTRAVTTVGRAQMKKAWQHLEPSDRWQDFYVKHEEFLAAETNFWSSFGGVSLVSDVPAIRARRR